MIHEAGAPDVGVVIRRITHYLTVRLGHEDFTALPRARLRKERVSLHVGDRVRLDEIDRSQMTAAIVELVPRDNLLPRPPIANVDQVVLVFAADRPAFSPQMLDRFLVLVSQSGIQSAIVLNKADLVAADDLDAAIAPYRDLGYPIVASSASEGRVESLWRLLAGRTTVFAGPSGVGKSSLLNAIHPGLALKEGEVSAKLQRGRHTTTFASLFALEREEETALVADTPGYSHLDFGDLEPSELGHHFPEIVPLVGQCRFPDCLHRQEPGCAVKESDALSPSRYASYLRFLEEVEANAQRRAAQSTKQESAVKKKAAAGGGETRLIRLGLAAREDSRRLAKQRLAGLSHDDAEDEAEEDAESP